MLLVCWSKLIRNILMYVRSYIVNFSGVHSIRIYVTCNIYIIALLINSVTKGHLQQHL